jgi:putative ABC transport system ATP-binding protein
MPSYNSAVTCHAIGFDGGAKIMNGPMSMQADLIESADRTETLHGNALVTLVNVVKDYPLGSSSVRALHGITLSFAAGEFTTIAGPSGCGKSTLLNLIGCMDKATSGTVIVGGSNTALLDDSALTKLRLNTVGFIFQSFNLIPVLTVQQNVELPLLLQGTSSVSERRDRVLKLLREVGLEEKAKSRSYELSGGQRQRVAVARALVTRPKLVLADEPTANLDSVTGQAILRLMEEMNREWQTTFIFSSHDPQIISRARRVIRLKDGRIGPTDDPIDLSGAH